MILELLTPETSTETLQLLLLTSSKLRALLANRISGKLLLFDKRGNLGKDKQFLFYFFHVGVIHFRSLRRQASVVDASPSKDPLTF